jgi:hypothetical protein
VSKKAITYKGITELEPKPCYDPKEIGMPETYQASIVEFIEEYKDKVKDKSDILWVVRYYLDDKTLRLFAEWCARAALKLIDNPDARSTNACDVAERFTNGKATKEELAAAGDSAWYSAGATARDSAWYSAWAAAGAAAKAAAWDSTEDSARDSAWYSALDEQIEQLLKMVKKGAEK